MDDVAKYYDILIDEGQDPVHDPKILKDYMDRWDGQLFIDKMQLDRTKSVLEIGVGTGRIAVKVAPNVLSFTGIDISKKTVEVAKKNIKNASLICADFLRFDFDSTFDVVYSSLTFMHIKEKKNAFCIVSDILNENGLFVLSVDKSRDEIIDTGTSKIKIFPDNTDDIKMYARNAKLKLVEETETEAAVIFTFIK